MDDPWQSVQQGTCLLITICQRAGRRAVVLARGWFPPKQNGSLAWAAKGTMDDPWQSVQQGTWLLITICQVAGGRQGVGNMCSEPKEKSMHKICANYAQICAVKEFLYGKWREMCVTAPKTPKVRAKYEVFIFSNPKYVQNMHKSFSTAENMRKEHKFSSAAQIMCEMCAVFFFQQPKKYAQICKNMQSTYLTPPSGEGQSPWHPTGSSKAELISSLGFQGGPWMTPGSQSNWEHGC